MEDLILQILAPVVTGLIGWGTYIIKQKFGIEIEAKHRQALQEALMTGAKLAVNKKLTGAKARELAVAYAKESVPDAIGYLRPTYNTLENLAESKIEDILGWRIEIGGEDGLADALEEAVKPIKPVVKGVAKKR